MALTAQLDRSRAQIGTVFQILRQDTWKRVLVSILISMAVGYFAGWGWAAATAGALFLNEVMFFYIARPATGSDVTAPAGLRRTLLAISFISASMLLYTAPGVILMAQPIQAAQILGLMWICAALVYILAIYTMTVILGWTTIACHTMGLILGIVLLHEGPVAPLSGMDMGVLAFFTGLWLWNAYEFMRASSNNRRAFAEARYQAEDRLKQLNFLVNHDHLTGILNRRAFEEALSDVMLTLGTADRLAVILIDLDGFKPINDTHGHAAGDAVLVEVAARLTAASTLRSPARLGGDEFVAVLPDIVPENLTQSIRGLASEVARPIPFDGTYLKVGASVGCAVAKPGMTVSQLIGDADAAMYLDKTSKRISATRGATAG